MRPRRRAGRKRSNERNLGQRGSMKSTSRRFASWMRTCSSNSRASCWKLPMTANDLMSQLTSVFVEWEGVLKDPQYIRNDDSVTWANAEIVILPEEITKA